MWKTTTYRSFSNGLPNGFSTIFHIFLEQWKTPWQPPLRAWGTMLAACRPTRSHAWHGGAEFYDRFASGLGNHTNSINNIRRTTFKNNVYFVNIYINLCADETSMPE
jgi:hypothetical protein